MKKDFIINLKEALELDGQVVKLSDTFRDYEEWSSLKELSLIAMLDSEYCIEIEMKELNRHKTVGDLIELIAIHSSRQ
jgi:acyl carrier protein